MCCINSSFLIKSKHSYFHFGTSRWFPTHDCNTLDELCVVSIKKKVIIGASHSIREASHNKTKMGHPQVI